ncbi:oxidoreductase [Novosphingobium barchaimii LL02]|uniref:Oxidoreductase n=1 Tax=Novosphingobium barchaimii LL02 TaxID=1114963 RepID=A0A0J7Y5X9_9SPHN|nr:oxidoreductase [Novosphingobium barchaimii]KMS59301.1 oxidoreductase [Novosphingobium barchaimii LL02]
MNRIGVGIIGNGMATRVFHAPYIQACDDLELKSIVDRKAGAVSPIEGARIVPDVAALLADPAIGLVVIATPSGTHAALARQVLEAGRHVVVEKPFTLALSEARDLAALARGRGLTLSVFHNRRWDTDFLAVRSALEAGLIGRVVHFESHFDRFRPHVRERWREDGSPGSGVWYDLGPHLIDQALVLFGRPDAVSADIAALREGSGSPDYAHVVLRYPGKRVIVHASMLVAGGEPRFRVHGTGGSLIKQNLDPQEAQSVAGLRPGEAEWGVDPDPLVHHDGEGGVRSIPAPRGSQERFYAMMAQACLGTGPTPAGLDEIVCVQEVLEAALVSAKEGRVVSLLP